MTSIDTITDLLKTAGPHDRAQLCRALMSDDPFWGSFPASFGRAMDPRTPGALCTKYEHALYADFSARREELLAAGVTYPSVRAILQKNGADISVMTEETLATLDAAGRTYLREMCVWHDRFPT